MDIKQLQQEVNRTEQLLAECDLEICTLQSLITHQEAGGSEIYDSAPPHAFKESEYRRNSRKKYDPKILDRSGQQILRDLKNSLSEHQQKLPKLVANYHKALAAYERAGGNRLL